MTDFQTIELNKDARGVATLWLNREDKNNAFDARVIGELNAALAQVQDDASIRFLILRGRGKHFSAGADLGWMRESAELDYQANLADAHELGELMQRLYQLPQGHRRAHHPPLRADRRTFRRHTCPRTGPARRDLPGQ